MDIIDALFRLMLFYEKTVAGNNKQQNWRTTTFMLHIAFWTKFNKHTYLEKHIFCFTVFMKPLSRYITRTAAAFTTLSTMFHQSPQPSCHINFLKGTILKPQESLLDIPLQNLIIVGHKQLHFDIKQRRL